MGKTQSKSTKKAEPVKNAKHQDTKKTDKKSDDIKKDAAAAKKAVTEKAAAPQPEKVTQKKEKSAKKSKAKKSEENEVEDDFVGEEFGDDEIGEYEEELKAVEELDEESDDVETWELEVKSNDEEVVLTDAEGNRYCRARDCDQISSVDVYCRYHYLLFWKKIQIRKKILQDGKLERYIEDLTARYPDKFLEMIRRDLRTEKDFLSAIQELEIDEAALDNDYEEDTQSYIDEVRGLGESTGVEEEEF